MFRKCFQQESYMANEVPEFDYWYLAWILLRGFAVFARQTQVNPRTAFSGHKTKKIQKRHDGKCEMKMWSETGINSKKSRNPSTLSHARTSLLTRPPSWPRKNYFSWRPRPHFRPAKWNNLWWWPPPLPPPDELGWCRRFFRRQGNGFGNRFTHSDANWWRPAKENARAHSL